MSLPPLTQPVPKDSFLRIFRIFLQLGLTSFGGPIAHLGYFRHAFVVHRRWVSEQDYAALISLCQFLPGPASSQVAIGLGLKRGGLPGGLAAWLGFTLPSAALLVALGLGVAALQERIPSGLLDGLKIVAVAIVAQAVWSMSQRFCPTPALITLALLAAAALLLSPMPMMPMAVILAGGLAGLVLPRSDPSTTGDSQFQVLPIHRGLALACLGLLGLLLIGLPPLVAASSSHALALFNSFLRAGSLVFGGGHVVLPLLQSMVVAPGWVTDSLFLSGYGAAQAVPGPLFSLAAYLGTVAQPAPNGLSGALLCLGAIYLPSFLLLIGTIPFWHRLQQYARVQQAQAGINAVVAGILLAALYDPIWISAIVSARHFILALAAFALLSVWRLPAWLTVILIALAGWGFLHSLG